MDPKDLTLKDPMIVRLEQVMAAFQITLDMLRSGAIDENGAVPMLRMVRDSLSTWAKAVPPRRPRSL